MKHYAYYRFTDGKNTNADGKWVFKEWKIVEKQFLSARFLKQ